MHTARRAAANARNARKSTGPRTPEGKAASSRNAIKHGLLSRQVLLAGENEDVLAALSARLWIAFRPQGYVEELLVDLMTSVVWKLRRLGRIEVGILSQFRGEILVERGWRNARRYTTDRDEEPYPTYGDGDKENYEAARARVQEVEAQLEKAKPTLGLAFIRDSRDSDALSKLSRYEVTLERSLYKALHELERVQAARAGHPVTPPIAVDVNVSQDG